MGYIFSLFSFCATCFVPVQLMKLFEWHWWQLVEWNGNRSIPPRSKILLLSPLPRIPSPRGKPRHKKTKILISGKYNNTAPLTTAFEPPTNKFINQTVMDDLSTASASPAQSNPLPLSLRPPPPCSFISLQVGDLGGRRLIYRRPRGIRKEKIRGWNKLKIEKGKGRKMKAIAKL